ncbi:MAG: acyl carrier protein [Blautia sp.]|nr:acyl carrier protein [Blautia sp.]
MDKLMEILEDIRPDIDFTSTKNLVTGGYMKSFDILTLVSEIEEEFGKEIPVEDVIPENFESVEAIMSLIERS